MSSTLESAGSESEHILGVFPPKEGNLIFTSNRLIVLKKKFGSALRFFGGILADLLGEVVPLPQIDDATKNKIASSTQSKVQTISETPVYQLCHVRALAYGCHQSLMCVYRFNICHVPYR